MNVQTGDDAAELIGRYQLAAAEHYLSAREVDSSGCRAAVRATNRHADELREIAAAIGRLGGAAIESFAGLLGERRHGIRNWAAFHILELMNPPQMSLTAPLQCLRKSPAEMASRPSEPKLA